MTTGHSRHRSKSTNFGYNSNAEDPTDGIIIERSPSLSPAMSEESMATTASPLVNRRSAVDIPELSTSGGGAIQAMTGTPRTYVACRTSDRLHKDSVTGWDRGRPFSASRILTASARRAHDSPLKAMGGGWRSADLAKRMKLSQESLYGESRTGGLIVVRQ